MTLRFIRKQNSRVNYNKLTSTLPFQNINDIADRIIYPSKAVIAILLLIIGIPTAGFSIDFIIESSVIGNILIWLSKI